MISLQGSGVGGGVAFAPLRKLEHTQFYTQSHPAADVKTEQERFERAREQAAAQLGEMACRSQGALGEENALLFEIHRMMIEDEDYLDSIRTLILQQNTGAEYAVSETARRFARMFAEMDDEYMRAREADVLDVSRRILRCLLGKEEAASIDEPSILFADDLAPSETAQLDPARVLGIACRGGSLTSHTAIFARTMGIPAVVGLGDGLSDDLDGASAILDAQGGALVIEPTPETTQKYRRVQQEQAEQKALTEEFRGRPTRTADGQEVRLYANISSAADARAAMANDAEGVGLFRSEALFLGRSTLPGEEEQYRVYAEAVKQMGGRPVIVRTLDVGADKKADCLALPTEENPALGLRALRVCLEQPQMFKTQLRAILRASAHGPMGIMVPMITSEWEVIKVKELLQDVCCQLEKEQIPFDRGTSLGIMVETPAAALISDRLAALVDFFSIGTNDLTQYTLAADRMNSRVARYYDDCHPAVLHLIHLTVESAHSHGIWAGVCGELAAKPQMIQELLRLGVDEISVPPPAVLGLRRAIAGCRVNRTAETEEPDAAGSDF